MEIKAKRNGLKKLLKSPLIKNSLILALITLVAGILLGGIYEITKEPRQKQHEIAKNNAYKAVFENNEAFKDIDISKLEFEEIDLDTLTNLNDLLEKNGLSGKAVIDSCVKAIDKENNIVGFVINVTAKTGYGGDISFSVGYQHNMMVTGISILSISETPGLGMKAKEASFLNQYTNKTGRFAVDKDNSAGKDNQIDSISGATITSRAMTDGVNAANVAMECIISGSDSSVNGGETGND